MYKTFNSDTNEYIEERYENLGWNTNLPTNPVNNPTISFKPTFLINVITGDGLLISLVMDKLNLITF